MVVVVVVGVGVRGVHTCGSVPDYCMILISSQSDYIYVDDFELYKSRGVGGGGVRGVPAPHF